ncbi:hypothetical protein [Halobellus marinus]|nr:hypothetical protein [Halobellus sp. DFY28]
MTRESEIEAARDDWERRAEKRRRGLKASTVDQIISERRAETKCERR